MSVDLYQPNLLSPLNFPPNRPFRYLRYRKARLLWVTVAAESAEGRRGGPTDSKVQKGNVANVEDFRHHARPVGRRPAEHQIPVPPLRSLARDRPLLPRLRA